MSDTNMTTEWVEILHRKVRMWFEYANDKRTGCGLQAEFGEQGRALSTLLREWEDRGNLLDESNKELERLRGLIVAYTPDTKSPFPIVDLWTEGDRIRQEQEGK